MSFESDYGSPSEMYSRKFVLLSKKGQVDAPDTMTKLQLEDGGLGAKYITGSVKEGESEVMMKVERHYSTIVLDGGLRWLRRSGKKLVPIMADGKEISGMTGNTLKKSGNFTIYLCPLQKSIDYYVECGQYDKCLNCGKFFYYNDLVDHCQICGSL